MNALRTRIESRRDAGFTLVELLVAMTLFLILSGIVLSAVMALSQGVDKARATSDITAEARLALGRISREVRQAQDVENLASNSMTVKVDFDGSGSIDGTLADPEVVTYAYNASTKSIAMTAKDAGGTTLTEDLLAGQVQSLTFSYDSSNWAKDANSDGTVTLAEAGPDGIDRVTINLVVQRDGQNQTFRTQVTLRNRSQS